MNPQSEIYGKPSGRAFSDEAAGYVVPFSALDLPFSFDTMEKQPTIKNLEGEIWKPIVGYEGVYEVSNKGRVKSLNYRCTKKSRLLTPQLTRDGYYQIKLCREGSYVYHSIHRLVFGTFNGSLRRWKTIKGKKVRMEINHINEIKTDNRLENLELVTRSQNINHGTRNERIRQKLLNKQGAKKVFQYTINGELVKIWKSTSECNRNGFHQGNVASCCRNDYKSNRKQHNIYKGYIWSYVPLKIESK